MVRCLRIPGWPFLLVLLGCTTTRVETPMGAGSELVAVTEPARAWRLETPSRLLGYVVLFADPRDPLDHRRHHFSVRNAWHQELGMIDVLGRAWRYVPHQREAQWLTTGTLQNGARAILGGLEDSALVECDLGSLTGRRSPSPES
jgi:hypothetical protein